MRNDGEATFGKATLGGASRPATVHRYRAFGLLLDSELRLPELETAKTSGSPDVRIRFRRIAERAPHPDRSHYKYGSTEQFLFWPTVGVFRIEGTNVIDIDPADGASDALLRLPLLGPVMALLMHMRGRLVLHASAVCINGRIAVFVGDKGAGKSTTTAAAIEHGHQMFTDDLLAVSFDDAFQPRADPGFPSVKLVTDCADMFRLNGAESLPIPTADFPKRVRRLSGAMPDAPVEVAAIYVLERSDKAEVSPCEAGEALRMIMRYAYIPLFDRKPWAPDETHRHFSQCAALASKVRVARLKTPSDLGRLGEIIHCVENDVAQSAAYKARPAATLPVGREIA